MPKTRTIQSLFRGKKPKSLGGGETKQRRAEYKNLVGALREKEKKHRSSFKQVIKYVRKNENKRRFSALNLVLPFLFGKAFSGNCKKFLEQIVFMVEINGCYAFRPIKQQEERLKNFIRSNPKNGKKSALNLIAKSREQLEKEYAKEMSQSHSFNYPKASNDFRHSLIGLKRAFFAYLYRLESVARNA